MSLALLNLRLAEERRFHDRQARARWQDLARDQGAGLRINPAAYLRHEPWIAPAFRMLGEVSGKCVLDFGCGHGIAGVLLAQRAAQVTGFDLSAGYVHEARARARANGVAARHCTLQAAGERLPFRSGAFDRIWGHAILHHLELPVALPEIRRVLRADGWAVFCEPWGGNPILEWARRRLPYPGKHRTRDEAPLSDAALRLLRKEFSAVTVYPFQLLGMVGRVWRGLRGWSGLARLDQKLLAGVPGLRRWCRYVVLVIRP
jgi:SAM-dependent methyltransferase